MSKYLFYVVNCFQLSIFELLITTAYENMSSCTLL